MKILISSYACSPGMGSEPGCGWNWALHYAKLGIEVWCLTTKEFKKEIENQLEIENLPNLKFIYISTNKALDYARIKFYPHSVPLHYVFWQKAAYKTSKRLNSKENFDFVHHTTFASLQMGSDLYKLNIPFIYGPVGGGQFSSPVFKKYFKSDWIKEIIRRYVSWFFINIFPRSKNTVRNASLVLATNHETKDLANSMGGKNVSLFLDSGLAIDFIPKAIPERSLGKELNILWVGKMLPRKGLNLLLQAFSKVDRSLPITLTLVGNGPMWKEVQKTIKSLEIVDKTICVGQVPYNQVKKFYESSDIFLFTSLRDSFGIQLLEAMAFGLPIICLNHQGAHSFVPESVGFKVNVYQANKTIDEIAKAIKYMYKYPKEREKFSIEAFEYGQNHSWTNKINTLMKVYVEFGIINKNDWDSLIVI